MAVPSSSTIPLELSSRTITPQPCPVCLDLDLGAVKRLLKDNSRPEFSLKTVVAASQAGCRGCKVLLFAVKSQVPEWDTNRIALEPVRRGCFIIYRFKTRGKLVELYKLPVQDDAKTRWPHSLPTKSPISGYTGSEEAMSKARSWLATCLLEYNTTCSMDQPTTLPTRVLRIDGPEKVALHISRGENAFYVCLSHCWGDKSLSLLRTTTASLEQFQSGIPWGIIPKTFREAIYVSQQLGLQYLWIDSLCIVQDSEEDWRHEGSMMASIYEFAHVTLAATKAPNADSGLFATSNASYLSRKMTLDSDDVRWGDAVDAIYCREEIRHYLGSDDSSHPLLSRGWAFQERLLARRIIYFTQQEIGFECKACNCCECLSDDACSLILDTAHDLHRMDDEHKFDLLTRQALWQDVVHEYSKRSLTYTKDIFPALQGLAKKFEKGMGRYYAGHWETMLVPSLAWNRRGNLRARPQSPAEWRAPTWSWASIDGPVLFCYDTILEAFVTVLYVSTTPIGDDPMGQISSGTLVLAGRCLYATLDVEWENEGDLKRYCVRSLQRADSEAGLLCSQDVDDVGFIPRFDYDFGIAGPYHVPNGSKILLMKILEVNTWVDHVDRLYLILRELDTFEHTCERIGIVKFYGSLHEKASTRLDQVFEEEAVEMKITIL